MLSFIIAVLAIVAAAVIYNVASSKSSNGEIRLSEKKIVDRFNRLVRSITPRNINVVKQELIDCLEEYKALKVAQFIDSRNGITSSIVLINSEINRNRNTISDVKRQIKTLKSSENPDVNLGAQLVYQYDTCNQIVKRMEDMLDNLNNKKVELDREIDQFNSKYGIKKAEISLKIVEAMALNNISAIDLHLNELVTEFDQKADEIKNANYVNQKVYHVEEEETEPLDLETYKEKFANFSE